MGWNGWHNKSVHQVFLRMVHVSIFLYLRRKIITTRIHQWDSVQRAWPKKTYSISDIRCLSIDAPPPAKQPTKRSYITLPFRTYIWKLSRLPWIKIILCGYKLYTAAVHICHVLHVLICLSFPYFVLCGMGNRSAKAVDHWLRHMVAVRKLRRHTWSM